MNRLVQVFAVVLLAVISCTGPSEKDESTEAGVHELHPNTLELTGKEILSPAGFAVSDSLFVLTERSLNQNFISIFNLNTGELVSEHGVRGRGPQEFSEIIQPVVNVNSSSGNKINLFDWGSKQVSLVDMQTSLTEETLTIQNSYELRPEFMLAQRAAFLNDDHILVAGGLANSFMAVISTAEHSYTLAESPEFHEDANPRTLRDLYTGKFAIDKNGEQIVHAATWIPRITIYDFSLEVLNTIDLFSYDLRTIYRQPEDDRTMYITDIKVTDEFIYAMVQNASPVEMYEFMEGNSADDSGYISEIYVLNREGELLNKLALKDGFYMLFDIDQLNNRIITIDLKADEHPLVWFELSEH